MSFRLKTIFGIALIEGFLLLMLIWTGLNLIHDSLEDQLVKRTSAIATLLATTIKDPVLSSDLATLESFTEEIIKNHDLIYARILDQNGIVLAEQGDPQALQQPFHADSSVHALNLNEETFDTFADIYEGNHRYGQVQVGVSVQIKALEVGAETIAGGKFGHLLPVRGSDELARTTQAFNTMSQQVQQLYGQLSAINEELKERVVERTAELSLIYRVSQILVDLDTPMVEQFAAIANAVKELLPESDGIRARISYEGMPDQGDEFKSYELLTASEIICEGKVKGLFELGCPLGSHLLQSADFRENKHLLLKTVCQDISTAIAHRESLLERQKIELQLRHAQKLEAVGQLAAGIAHEINTPTQYINDNMNFLKQAFSGYDLLREHYARLESTVSTDTSPQYEHLIKEIEACREDIDIEYLESEIPQALDQSLDGLARVSKIVRAMKEFSHPGSEEKVPTDLNSAIETTIDISRNEWKNHAELVKEFDPELPLVSVLPGEFNQVLLNLIINAAHAIEARGADGQGEIRIKTCKNGEDAVYIHVIDNGSGIPSDIKNRIFDPFFTTKEVGMGSGQGLTIAYSIIVDKHHGSLEVESEEGKGTRFTISLPLK